MKIGGAGNGGDGLFAGIDQLRVFLSGGRGRSHAQQPVLRLKNHLASGGHELGHQFRQADAQVDDGAIMYVRRDEAGHFLAAPLRERLGGWGYG